jgi:hypothetical protein
LFEAVTEGLVAALEAELGALMLAGKNQVFYAPSGLDSGSAADSASFIPLHSQLILPLTGQGRIGKFVLNWLLHRSLKGRKFHFARLPTAPTVATECRKWEVRGGKMFPKFHKPDCAGPRGWLEFQEA